MNWLALLSGLRGYRTHMAVIISVLTALSTAAGMLPTATGQSLTMVFGGLALSMARFAQSDLAKKLDALLQDSNLPTDANGSTPASGGPTADLKDGPVTLRFPTMLLLVGFGVLISGEMVSAQTTTDRPTVRTSMELSPEVRGWARNPDGSCVQCSISMCGWHANDLNAGTLLWDTDYGSAIRGGSWPSRVEAYCDRRGIKAWSVTASSVDETLPWMAWAAKTRRFAAIGAGSAHFQTLYGYEPADPKPWLVCNNNSTSRIDRYGEAEFRRLHAASGPWVVILEKPSSEPPELRRWWK